MSSDTIRVYKSANPSAMQYYASELHEHLRIGLEIAEGDTVFSVADDGAITFESSHERALQSLSAQSEAASYLLSMLRAADRSVSSDGLLTDARIPCLFGGANTEIGIVSATDNTGSDSESGGWSFRLGIALRKARRGGLALVADASISATVSINGAITSLESSWRPVVGSENTDRYPLLIADGPSLTSQQITFSEDGGKDTGESSADLRIELQYLYTPQESLVVPIYAFVGGERGDRFPACSYSVMNHGY